jgi:hypothetical protein
LLASPHTSSGNYLAIILRSIKNVLLQHCFSCKGLWLIALAVHSALYLIESTMPHNHHATQPACPITMSYSCIQPVKTFLACVTGTLRVECVVAHCCAASQACQCQHVHSLIKRLLCVIAQPLVQPHWHNSSCTIQHTRNHSQHVAYMSSMVYHVPVSQNQHTHNLCLQAVVNCHAAGSWSM